MAFAARSIAVAAAFAIGAPSGAIASQSLFTVAQAARGQDDYDHYCSTCHGEHLDDGDFGGPPLKGAYFRSHWGSGAASVLFAYVKSLMPPDNPGELNDDQYARVLAFILQGNGYKAGRTPFPTDPSAQARLSLKQE